MLSDADGHVDVAGSRLFAIGAQQVIPPREIEAVVAVGFAADRGMMHAVHFWRDQCAAQDSVQPQRQAGVAVVEYRRRVEYDLED